MLVVGGGLAGMEAAITAAETGIRVVLADSDPHLDGFDALRPAASGFIRKYWTSILRSAR
ncbi:MAG: FAD-binding protein [Gammaproteobacteria bacterium]|nr:FAD-binding protein [Gammaproteobacteria bacterium]MDH5213163.1 FAD-binding protein [Gammaproteobacteria bacterium]MDH5500767.1 FAD-binding protein [Gammaproteobacteria bacterium]